MGGAGWHAKPDAEIIDGEAHLANLEARIQEDQQNREIIRTSYSRIDPKRLFGMNAFSLDRVLEMDPGFLEADGADHVHDDSVSSVAWKFPGLELSVKRLQRWIGLTMLQESGQDLYRYKGVLAVKGVKEKFVFQGVHMLFSGGLQEDLEWGDDEERECRCVFIGKKMKQEHGEKLRTGFLECEAEKELRFNVGDKVMARARGREKGRILKIWDQGNPYRIELQNRDNTNVWGPEDSDICVRSV